MPKSMDEEGFKFPTKPQRPKTSSQKEAERQARIEEAIAKSRARRDGGMFATCFIDTSRN